MVLDVVKPREIGNGYTQRLGERLTNAAQLLAVPKSIANEREIGAAGQGEFGLAYEVRPRIAANRDVGNVFASNSGVLQTLANGKAWESRPVLDASEALFLECHYELAVIEQSRGNIAVIRIDA